MNSSQNERGVRRALAAPRVYGLFARLVCRPGARAGLVASYVRPFPGCRILDVGCGTAAILSDLPRFIGEYLGFDMNPHYIRSARRRFRHRPGCRFLCCRIGDEAPWRKGHWDLVMALGVLHHLDDVGAARLFAMAREVLKPGGVLLTYDNVHVPNQNRFARWLMACDRGQAVRSVAGYVRLAEQRFEQIETEVRHDFLRVPYTVLIMRCLRPAVPTAAEG